MTAKKILSNMFFPIEPRGNLECVTSVPREIIDDDGRALIDGLRSLYTGSEGGVPVGSDILVKVLDADGENLLHRRLFTVLWSGQVRRTGMDSRGIEIVANVHDYILEPVGDWWSASKLAEVEEEPAPEPELERYVLGEGEIKWNPGKKTYEIRVDGEIMATERDKERALAIASGSAAFPMQAA